MKKFYTLLLLGMLYSVFGISQSKLPYAEAFIRSNQSHFQLKNYDLGHLILTDENISSLTGVTNIYLRQSLYGIEVVHANFNIHLSPENEILHYGNRLITNLEKRIESNIISINPITAIKSLAESMGYIVESDPVLISQHQGQNQHGWYRLAELSNSTIPIKLVFQPTDNGRIRLAWDIVLSDHFQTFNARIDAKNGTILESNSWTIECTWSDLSQKDYKHLSVEPSIARAEQFFTSDGEYKVLPYPVESPNHGAREMISDPSDPSASPYGWHDTDGSTGNEFTTTKGNNVHAQLDDDADNDTEGFSPDGGPDLIFDFQIDFEEEPGSYDSASITNLFYWSNVIHDILYQYGFDEQAGNFQDNNYGNGGEEGDYVMADAQDAASSNNANFTTPPDGTMPRMQMFLWNTSSPELDGDLDNGIITHEYTHGLSNRLTGGPSNVSCLGNREQMGEGWSDWFSLMLTIEEGDSRTDIRGLGTYALNEETDGNGIRSYPYSTDFGINPHTYDDIKTEPVPHGVGSVWCAMLWELTWDLIDEYGFDSDLYYGNGGNNKAMALVVEAMKYQPCSPGFIDGRNAILAADRILYDGDNQCLIWQSFARRGLGHQALQGDADDRSDGTESYELPPDCSLSLSITGNTSVTPGSNITYNIDATNVATSTINDLVIKNMVPENTTYVSSSNGGSLVDGEVVWPAINLGIGQSINRSFTVELNPDVDEIIDITDDIESGEDHWSTYATSPGLSEWVINSTNPNGGSNSWFADDKNNNNDQYLTTRKSFFAHDNTELIFWHHYDTEFRWDGGKVQISTDMGNTWSDLADQMTQNGYNSYIDNNPDSPAFSGNGNFYVETKVDLSSFDGQEFMIRFWMHTDGSVGDDGWYIDDVSLVHVGQTIPDTVRGLFDGMEMKAVIFPTTQVSESNVPAELIAFEGNAKKGQNNLLWKTASESNVNSFEIQTTDLLSNQWVSLDQVLATGNSSQLQTYSYVHKTGIPISYYRLKIKDHSGYFEYSNIIRLEQNFTSFQDFNIHPNPNEGLLNLDFSLEKSGKVDLQLRDSFGRKVYELSLDSEKGFNQFSIDLRDLESGIFFLSIKNVNEMLTEKLILNK